MTLVLSPRAGVAGIIASLQRLGVVFVDIISGAGAITKYTVGPAWTGAEFATIQAAVDQAVLDGHSGPVLGQTVEIQIYPGVYPDPVTIPESLPRFNLVGQGRNVGVRIAGLFTLNLPSANCTFSCNQIAFVGGFSILQPVVVSTVTGYFFNCATFSGAPNVVARGLSIEAYNCVWQGSPANWDVRQADFYDCQVASSTANVSTFTSVTFARLYDCRVSGIVNFNGVSGIEVGCTHAHAGSPAVNDATTLSSFCQGNVFLHDAGPVGPVWVKTGPGNFHDGGNTFVEGQEYPWFSLTGAGTRSDRAEGDNELRRVFLVSGSPVLTAAQVGSQRKTTVGKTDGGGVVTLPALATVEPGCTVPIKDINGNAGAAPFDVAGDGAETIDGSATISLTTNFECIELQAVSATNWARIGRYP